MVCFGCFIGSSLTIPHEGSDTLIGASMQSRSQRFSLTGEQGGKRDRKSAGNEIGLNAAGILPQHSFNLPKIRALCLDNPKSVDLVAVFLITSVPVHKLAANEILAKVFTRSC